MLTGALVLVALFLKLEILVKTASAVFMLSYILCSVSVVVLRESGLQNYRPRFRTPLYPWVQIAGVVGFAFVILEMGEEAFLISVALSVAAFSIYWFYGRANVRRESALLHLIQRITAKELVTGSLEMELKQIIRERDEIALDRFDSVVEDSTVLDLREYMDAEGFLGLLAQRAAKRVGADASELLGLLRAREREGSTILRPGLAIPHIIVDGKESFHIILARSMRGVLYGEDARPVHAVFVLVGTKDERNFHLQALAALAQITQDPEFDERWMAARDEQALRDVVLLGERRRESHACHHSAIGQSAGHSFHKG